MRISDWSSDVCSSDLRLPKPSPPASPLPCTGGPPDSDQTSTTCSSVSSQWISTRPVSDDRAPYLAALVTNSCSSRAMLVTGGQGAIGVSATVRWTRPPPSGGAVWNGGKRGG